MRVIALALMIALLNMMGACYTYYPISMDNLAKLQQGADRAAAAQAEQAGAGEAGEEAFQGVTVTTISGNEVEVTQDSWVFLDDMDGIRHRIPAFTYKMTETQFLAPEQDVVMGTGWIENAEVRKISLTKTLLAVGSATVTTLAFIIGIISTAGEDTGYN